MVSVESALYQRMQVRFERWEDGSPVISVANGMDRDISFEAAFALGGMELPVSVSNNSTLTDAFSIPPNRELEVTLWKWNPMEKPRLTISSGANGPNETWPPDEIDVIIVPWTTAGKNEAKDRYGRLPQFMRNWLMRKFTILPEHRCVVNIPPNPAKTAD